MRLQIYTDPDTFDYNAQHPLFRTLIKMETQSAVIFLHISKTGGTTLRSIIKRQFSPDTIYDLDPSYFVSASADYDNVMAERVTKLKAMSDAEKKQFRCFFHPGAYGLHEILPQNTQYFTFLRDPIDHFISSYYFAVNNVGHVHHDLIKRENLSIEDFANYLKPDNLQTRRLSACDSIEKLSAASGLKNPLGIEDLENAKIHLKQMPIFGLMERYDESLLLIQDCFSWNKVTYKSRNVAPKRIKLEELSPKLRQKLETDLALDIALYEFAAKLFQSHLESSRLDMEKALKRFRQENIRLAEGSAIKERLKNILKLPFGQKR